MYDYLKITRKRLFSDYLHQIEMLSFYQGSNDVVVDSLRWNRLQLCVDSIKHHLFSDCGFLCERF